MRFIYNIFLILALSAFLFSCGGFKLQKKATSGDEFLIEKKDPLVLPPDFSKLPKPNEQPETTDKDINLKSVFDGNQNSADEGDDNQNSSKSNIKKSISEKIQKQ
tara:strand:- start:272 stop:586 length:315 start_codon:yes stop_codon:yes gene_type:complete